MILIIRSLGSHEEYDFNTEEVFAMPQTKQKLNLVLQT